MLTVLGSQIHLHSGDDSSFKVLYRDKYDNLKNFDPTDIITMTIRHRDSSEVLITRIAESVIIENEPVTILRFFSRDARILTPNSYLYDLVIETVDGFRYTLISRGVFNVLDNPAYRPSSMGITTGRLVSITTDELYLSPYPLICKYIHKKVRREEAEGTLIMFNRLLGVGGEEEDSDPSNDTLILFNNSQISDEESEETLILF